MAYRLRIALVTQFTLENILSDSGFWIAYRAAQLFIEQGHTCFILVPPLKKEQVFLLPRIKGLHYEMANEVGTYMSAQRHLSSVYDLIHPRQGTLVVDVVWTIDLTLASLLQQWQYESTVGSRYRVWLNEEVAFSPRSPVGRMHWSKDRMGVDNRTGLGHLRALGYVAPNLITTPTQGMQDEIIAAATGVLAPSIVRTLRSHIRIAPFGLEMNQYDEIDCTKAEKFTLFFGARLNALKRPHIMLESYVQQFAQGEDCEIVICSPKSDSKFGEEMTEAVAKVVQFRPQTTKAEFLKQAARSHVCVYPSAFEGYTVGVIEMLLLGVVVILPRLPWATTIVGEDYPFFFDKPVDTHGILTYVVANFNECQNSLFSTVERVRKQFNKDVCDPKVVACLNDLRDFPYYDVENHSMGEPLLKAVKCLPNRFDVEDLLRALDRYMALSSRECRVKTHRSRRILSVLGLKRLMEVKGWAVPVPYTRSLEFMKP